MGFDLCNCFLKIPKVHQDFNSQHGNSFKSVSVHFHTLPHSRASLLACALASPCIGRKPKLRVVTILLGLFSPPSHFHPLFSHFYFHYFLSSYFIIINNNLFRVFFLPFGEGDIFSTYKKWYV